MTDALTALGYLAHTATFLGIVWTGRNALRPRDPR